MESLNEIITHWYPVLFLISAGIALAVWAWASKRKARLDIDQATILFLNAGTETGRCPKRNLNAEQQPNQVF